jgi:hypothetical protein
MIWATVAINAPDVTAALNGGIVRFLLTRKG